jgi:3-dehydroquinate dehydratase
MVTLFDVHKEVRSEADRLRPELLLRRSRHEARMITRIHRAGPRVKPGNGITVMFDPGLEANFDCTARCNQARRPRLIEPHISDQHNGSKIRRHSQVSPVARGIISGFRNQGIGAQSRARTR